MKSLVKKIRELQRDIEDSIEYLNDGGCIQFAYFFSRRLTELKIEHKICLSYNYNYGLEGPIKFSYDKFQVPSHVLVFIKEIGYIDGYKTYTIKSMNREYEHRLTKKTSLKKLNWFRTEGDWNDSYNTNQNSLLNQLINEKIS